MTPVAANSVEKRLEELERQNVCLICDARRAKCLLFTLMAGAGVAILCGAYQTEGPMKVSQLNVVGPNGKTRISLFVTESGDAQVDFFDAHGDSHVKLFTGKDGGTTKLLMRDAKDNVRLDLGIDGTTNATGLRIDGRSL